MQSLEAFTGHILVVEDEPLLARALLQQLRALCPNAALLPAIGSAHSLRVFANTQVTPDLILADIQLSDGLSLSALDAFPPNTPVVFVTAYDHYTLKIFRFNAIDYLLKPLREEALIAALKKYLLLHNSSVRIEPTAYTHLAADLLTSTPSKPTRMLLHQGRSIVPVQIQRLRVFLLEGSLVRATDNESQWYITDFRSLDEVEEDLEPNVWFRANRQSLIARDAVVAFEPDETGRLLLKLQPELRHSVTISKDKAATFKRWLAQAELG